MLLLLQKQEHRPLVACPEGEPSRVFGLNLRQASPIRGRANSLLREHTHSQPDPSSEDRRTGGPPGATPTETARSLSADEEYFRNAPGGHASSPPPGGRFSEIASEARDGWRGSLIVLFYIIC